MFLGEANTPNDLANNREQYQGTDRYLGLIGYALNVCSTPRCVKGLFTKDPKIPPTEVGGLFKSLLDED